MENKTLEFEKVRDWRRVCEALNDTMYTFTAYEIRRITIWGTAAIEDVLAACEWNDIPVKEVSR